MVTRERCREVEKISRGPSFGLWPLQLGMGGCPWRTAVCAMFLCRTRRTQAEPILREVLERWPTAADLAHADESALEQMVRPLGLQRNRARQLVRFSSRYLTDGWEDLEELPGVGVYVLDSVRIFVFHEYDGLRSSDSVLAEYVRTKRIAG